MGSLIIREEELDDIPMVNEPAAVYNFVSMHDNKDSTLLHVLDKFMKLNDDILAFWLNVTTRTLRNYRLNPSPLKENQKEHLVMILSLYKHGDDVFGSTEAFEKWLLKPNFFLDNKAPKDFMDTISGIHLVDNRLTAMEFGENV